MKKTAEHLPRVVRTSKHAVRVRSFDGSVTGVVQVDSDSATARLDFAVERGRRIDRASDDVLAAIFELPELAACHEIKAALPLGAGDLVGGLTMRLPTAHTRAAGVTCLLDATVPVGA